MATDSNLQPPPKRKRRWWFWIVFAIFAATIAFSIQLIANPSDAHYRFIKGAELKSADEGIYPVRVGVDTYSWNRWYKLKQTFGAASKAAKEELMPKGFRVTDSSSSIIFFEKSSLGSQVAIINEHGHVTVILREGRNATFLDRARLKLRSLFSSKKPTSVNIGETN